MCFHLKAFESVGSLSDLQSGSGNAFTSLIGLHSGLQLLAIEQIYVAE